MRALWIEDHQLIGDSLEMLLQVLMSDVSIDKARDIDIAVRFAESIPYELVLLDWWLGQVDGATTIKALRTAGCLAPVLVVSGDERDVVLRQALAAGAVGYVTKSAEPEALIQAIRDALGGIVRRAPRVAFHASEPLTPLPALDVREVFPELTSRQADVFRGLMRGEADKQIARDLGLSGTTVKTHVRAILQVVGVSSRGAAAYAARSRGAGEG